MQAREKLFNVLRKYMPEEIVDYCIDFWVKYPFNFTVTKKRDSKFGDYRYHFIKKEHTITINGDLNKYAFLITYLHEVAHLKTNILYGHKVKPHGQEWKSVFKDILEPLLKDNVFPEAVKIPLYNYIRDPKASSCTDLELMKALKNFDEKSLQCFLEEVKIGETFIFNKRIFVKEEVKRSRALCKEVSSRKKYYIPESALIQIVGQTKLIF